MLIARTVGGLGATSVGTPEIVADEMEKWVEDADVDGFNIVSGVAAHKTAYVM